MKKFNINFENCYGISKLCEELDFQKTMLFQYMQRI